MTLADFEDAPYLMKINEVGDFVWDTWDFSTSIFDKKPISGCMIINNDYYFVCKQQNETGRQPVLMKITDDNQTPVEIARYGNVDDKIVPFYSMKKSENEILILSARPNERLTWLINTDINGNVIWEKEFNYEAAISVKHPSLDNRFHFLNMWNDFIYYTSYYGNDIASLVLDSSGEVLDTIYYTDALDNNVQITSMATFDNTVSFSFPQKDIYAINSSEQGIQTENGISSTNNSFMERIVVDNRELALFSASARDNQILLKVFDPYNIDNGTYKKYYGHTYFYEAGGILPTNDGGLMIYGNAYVLGRLGRICMIKLSKTDIQAIANQISGQ